MGSEMCIRDSDRAVREKVTIGGAGIRWDRVVDKVRKDIGGNQEDTVHRQVCGVQDRSKRKDRNKGKASAQKHGEGGGTLRDLRGVKRRNRNENVFVRPSGLHEDAETAISCWGPEHARKKKEVYQ